MADTLHYERQCHGKTQHTETEAEIEARRLHKLNKSKYSTYACSYCNHFHVGRVRSAEAGYRRFQRAS